MKDNIDFNVITIKDVVSAINNKQLTIKDIANHFKLSNRTIQTKIKKLGFVWDSKNACYTNNTNKNDLILLHNAISNDSNSNVKTNSNNTVNDAIKSIDNTISNILNNDNSNNKRKGKMFYIDSDLLSALDKIKNKSDFVNACIRKVMLEHKLL